MTPEAERQPLPALPGMDASAIRRYAAARKRIDESADLICSISLVFSHFEDWPDDRIAISPFALGKLNDLVNRHACRILSELEDFATANEANDFVEKLDGSEKGDASSMES